MAAAKSSRSKKYKVEENPALPTANETTAIYGSKSAQSAVLLNVGGKPESNLTAMEKLNLSRSGITKLALEHLKHTTGLDYDRLAKGLSVTKATLFSKKGAERFGSDLSEKIISLADIYSYGYEVFGDTDKFNAWMHHPNQALGGETPYGIVDNQFGREEVKNLIGRIEYGVYS